jgi:hypothetical protein
LPIYFSLNTPQKQQCLLRLVSGSGDSPTVALPAYKPGSFQKGVCDRVLELEMGSNKRPAFLRNYGFKLILPLEFLAEGIDLMLL